MILFSNSLKPSRFLEQQRKLIKSNESAWNRCRCFVRSLLKNKTNPHSILKFNSAEHEIHTLHGYSSHCLVFIAAAYIELKTVKKGLSSPWRRHPCTPRKNRSSWPCHHRVITTCWPTDLRKISNCRRNTAAAKSFSGGMWTSVR